MTEYLRAFQVASREDLERLHPDDRRRLRSEAASALEVFKVRLDLIAAQEQLLQLADQMERLVATLVEGARR